MATNNANKYKFKEYTTPEKQKKNSVPKVNHFRTFSG